MNYGLLITLHLLAAFAFVGTIFFEVVMLEGVRKHLPREIMREVERAIGDRAVKIMPWVLLILYSAGIAMAWQHYAALSQPFSSSFGLLLSIKIVLAISVFGHFVTAMVLRKRHLLNSKRSLCVRIPFAADGT